MAKIYVAQTHEVERRLLCESLNKAGYQAHPYQTDMTSLMWLSREMAFLNEPAVIISSQRNLYGCDYVSNIIHAVVSTVPARTLTVVYSQAAAYPGHIPEMVNLLAKLSSTSRHGLKIVPKLSEETRPKEHGIILSHVIDFNRSLAVS